MDDIKFSFFTFAVQNIQITTKKPNTNENVGLELSDISETEFHSDINPDDWSDISESNDGSMISKSELGIDIHDLSDISENDDINIDKMDCEMPNVSDVPIKIDVLKKGRLA